MLERGHLEGAPLRVLRAVLRALDASADVDIRWRGGAIDRLIDEWHASLVARAVTSLNETGWQTLVEVTYSVYGERGSIDVLGWKADERAAVVVEVKSDLTSVEQTQRKHDEKVRLAPKIVRERAGCNVRTIGRLLVFPEPSTSRRRLDRAAPLLAGTYPLRQREVREWLARPVGSMGGILLLPDTTPSGARTRIIRSRSR